MNSRTLIGFVVAPLLPALMVGFFDRPAALVIALFGYPTVLVLGLPAHLLLQKFAWSGWLPYVGAGFIAGALGGALAGTIMMASDHRPPGSRLMEYVFDALMTPIKDPLPFLFLGFLGAVGALTFWLVARPDAHHSIPLPS